MPSTIGINPAFDLKNILTLLVLLCKNCERSALGDIILLVIIINLQVKVGNVMKVLFATTNQAKVLKYKKIFEENGIELITIKDLGFKLDIEENGKMRLKMLI